MKPMMILRRHVLLLLGLCLLMVLPTAASASVTTESAAERFARKALEVSSALPGCSGVIPEGRSTTDKAPPQEVLRRYSLFRNPQPADEQVVPLTSSQSGLLSAPYERTRTVEKLRVTVAPLLDWSPPVRPRKCDAYALKLVRKLRKQPRAVRLRAVAIVTRRTAANERIRRLPPRTLLLIGVANQLGADTAGALALSAQRGLYALFGSAGGRAVAVGLIPDGVANVRFRALGKPDVTVAARDNIVVARLPWLGVFGRGRQTVWTDADGKVVRTIGKLGARS